jgi:signal peptidase I
MATTERTPAVGRPVTVDANVDGRCTQPQRASRRRSLRTDAAILLVCALIGAFGTKVFIAQIFSIPSGSMQATVAPGERVIVEKVSHRFRPIARGDVVVFDGTDVFNPPTPGANIFIKRVIGLPGERVACCDSAGKLTVNGAPLNESEYLYPSDAPSTMRFDVVVPKGKLWLMGDHRSDSADSRAYLGSPGGGFVPEDRVAGRAMWVVWPISSARSIDTPTYRR